MGYLWSPPRSCLESSLAKVESGLLQGGSKAARLRADGKQRLCPGVKVNSMRKGLSKKPGRGET